MDHLKSPLVIFNAEFLNLQAKEGHNILRALKILKYAKLEEEKEGDTCLAAWQTLAHRSSCFLLFRKAGPFPTMKLHLDIPAGKSPSKSHEAPSRSHSSSPDPWEFLFPLNSAALTLSSFVGMVSTPSLA